VADEEGGGEEEEEDDETIRGFADGRTRVRDARRKPFLFLKRFEMLGAKRARTLDPA